MIRVFSLLILLGAMASTAQAQPDTTRKFLFTVDHFQLGVSNDARGFSGEIESWMTNALGGRATKYDYDPRKKGAFSFGFQGPTIGSEFDWADNDFWVSPKVGYRIQFLLLDLDANAFYRTNFNDGALHFNPNVGIYLWPFISIRSTLYYGYNFNIVSSDRFDISGHRIRLTWNPIFYNRKYQEWRLR